MTEAGGGADAKPLQRQLVIAAMIVPGHADHSITIALGYGRKHTGPAGEEAGFNAYLLRTIANPHFIIADGTTVKSVEVKKAGGTYKLATTQEHWSIEGRGLVREATIERYRADNDFVTKIGGDDELPSKLPSLYSHPPDDRAAAVGHGDRPEHLHRLQRLRRRLPGGE